mmetsp:Transcript_28017/g.5117  ORF Transcript_28017/g.5117 Transcript_28017/m.5117 type:complete len:132 (+) Transcript_28017:455-850(+)
MMKKLYNQLLSKTFRKKINQQAHFSKTKILRQPQDCSNKTMTEILILNHLKALNSFKKIRKSRIISKIQPNSFKEAKKANNIKLQVVCFRILTKQIIHKRKLMFLTNLEEWKKLQRKKVGMGLYLSIYSFR